MNEMKETDLHLFDCLDCFLFHPDVMTFDAFPIINSPITYENIRIEQQSEPALLLQAQNDPATYQTRTFNQVDLICVRNPRTNAFNICLPTAILPETVEWYHQMLGHVGATRLFSTIAAHLSHPQLRQRVEAHVGTCITCKEMKLAGRGYGQLPPREAKLLPFEEIACDSIGPWTIPIPGLQLKFSALTTICTVSNLCELVRKNNDSSVEAGRLLEQSWLHRYPRPARCIHDGGPEFKYGFLRILQRWGIKNVPITAHNPQANSICERLHQTVAQILRTYIRTNPPQNQQEATTLIDHALSSASHAMRAATHRTLNVSPGAIVFHRDMMLNVPLIAELITLRDRRQQLIDYNLQRANAKRRFHDYQVGDLVSDLAIRPSKLDPRASNRFRIVQVHTNGTVVIERRPGVLERINIRRLRPL
jgi:hypothetical protein